jgi:hypothetical protein
MAEAAFAEPSPAGGSTMMRQIELWGERIIPAIRRELGPDLAQASVFAAAAG